MAARAGTARGKTPSGGRKPVAATPTARSVDAQATGTTKRRRSAGKSAAERKLSSPSIKPAEPLALGKLGQIALAAKDLNKAVAFYKDVLGLRMIARFDPAGLVFFRLGGGVRLLLSATASSASLYFTVDDLDASVEQLRARGVKFLQKPAMIHRDDDGDFGKKGTEEWMAFFRDPSGNLLALVERR